MYPLHPATYIRLINVSDTEPQADSVAKIEPVRTNGIQPTSDTEKSMVVRILENDFSDIMDKRWLDEWLGDESSQKWERLAILKKVDQSTNTVRRTSFMHFSQRTIQSTRRNTKHTAESTRSELPKNVRGRSPENQTLVGATDVRKYISRGRANWKSACRITSHRHPHTWNCTK